MTLTRRKRRFKWALTKNRHKSNKLLVVTNTESHGNYIKISYMKIYRTTVFYSALFALLAWGVAQAQYDDLYYNPDTDGEYYDYSSSSASSGDDYAYSGTTAATIMKAMATTTTTITTIIIPPVFAVSTALIGDLATSTRFT